MKIRTVMVCSELFADSLLKTPWLKFSFRVLLYIRLRTVFRLGREESAWNGLGVLEYPLGEMRLIDDLKLGLITWTKWPHIFLSF